MDMVVAFVYLDRRNTPSTTFLIKCPMLPEIKVVWNSFLESFAVNNLDQGFVWRTAFFHPFLVVPLQWSMLTLTSTKEVAAIENIQCMSINNMVNNTTSYFHKIIQACSGATGKPEVVYYICILIKQCSTFF